MKTSTEDFVEQGENSRYDDLSSKYVFIMNKLDKTYHHEIQLRKIDKHVLRDEYVLYIIDLSKRKWC